MGGKGRGNDGDWLANAHSSDRFYGFENVMKIIFYNSKDQSISGM